MGAGCPYSSEIVVTDPENLSTFWIVAIPLATTFVCAALLRARGVTGLLAIAGMLAMAIAVVGSLRDWRMAVAVIAMLVGITAGAKLSDKRHAASMKREREEEDRRRNLARNRYSS